MLWLVIDLTLQNVGCLPVKSTSIAEHLDGHLVENNLLVPWSLVFDHERTNPVLLRLAHRHILHVVP